MGNGTACQRASTRRDYMRYGGTVVGGGLLAGCSSLTAGDDQSDEEGAYTVEMAPMGEVSVESVPESIFTRLTHMAGMAFALGRASDVNAMYQPEYYDALWNQFTPRLPGVELDWTGLYSAWEPSKEKLYDLDSDIHLADPAGMAALDSWDNEDVEEIADQVAPWFGNYYSDRHADPPSGWAEEYEYYGLWEIFEKVAQLFREQERYDALAEVRENVLAEIETRLPAQSERPTAVMAGFSEVERPYIYKTNVPGFLTAHLRPLQARDAFGRDLPPGSHQVDLEAMLEADPDVIFALGGMHPARDLDRIRNGLANHPVAREVTAVKNGRVYGQGARYQGPILNLFQTEMAAKQLYPDQFGTWPGTTAGQYPEFPADEQLFDRQRVAAVINGEL
jgi:ABC-type Fe3+-hydroxamate transport system substrate-binding protein